jgi:GTP-binding protein HflX
LPGIDSVVLADTVGFIRHLPHDLVEAFRSTLEETSEANLLLHVIDASDEEHTNYIAQVNRVLEQVGADSVPQIQVYNKIDLTENKARIDRDDEGKVWRVWVSANTGEGVDLLREALAERLTEDLVRGWLRISASDGRIRAQLYELGAVVSESREENGGSLLEISLSRRYFNQILKSHGEPLEIIPYPEEHLATRVHAT